MLVPLQTDVGFQFLLHYQDMVLQVQCSKSLDLQPLGEVLGGLHRGAEAELQNLVAVLECTSKEMVPKRFQSLDRTKLVRDIRELKSLIGEQ